MGKKGERGCAEKLGAAKELHSESFLDLLSSPISPLHNLSLRGTGQVVERTVDVESESWILISVPLQTWEMTL